MPELNVGIYLIVEFEWPRPFSLEHAQKARKLHDVVQGRTWIKEVVAASGGLGDGPPSIWIFWLPDYAALDRLLRNQEDPVSQAYTAFFSEMPVVKDKIREEVAFL
jgi:hypothetical protein